MRNAILFSALMIAGLLVIASCQSKSGRPAQGDAASSPQKHWVQNEKLKGAMADLSRLHGSLPKDLPEDVESPTGRMIATACASAATAADHLAGTAGGLGRYVEGKKLSEADRRGFTALAETLRDQAVRLRGESEKMQIEKMQRTMDDVTQTCMACHGRYRELAGDVDVSKTLAPKSN